MTFQFSPLKIIHCVSELNFKRNKKIKQLMALLKHKSTSMKIRSGEIVLPLSQALRVPRVCREPFVRNSDLSFRNLSGIRKISELRVCCSTRDSRSKENKIS